MDFPKFQAIKENSVVLTINEKLHNCVGKVGGFKISDAVGTSIHISSAYDMVLNPNLDFFVCHHSWRLEFMRREPHTTLYDFSIISVCRKGISGRTWCNGNDISSQHISLC